MSNLLKSRYRLVIPYIIVVLVSYTLRLTPLNSCSVFNDEGVCFGQVDFFLLLLSFPGWLSWLVLNLLPEIIRMTLLNFTVGILNLLSIQFNSIFIPSSFVISAVILYGIGLVSERFVENDE